jgi:hypothetical protein
MSEVASLNTYGYTYYLQRAGVCGYCTNNYLYLLKMVKETIYVDSKRNNVHAIQYLQ